MKKHILIAIGLASIAIPAIAEDTLRVPFNTPVGQIVPATKEIDVDSLKALVAAAETRGDHTVFIGSPIVWAADGKTSKPGAYLTDGNTIIVRDKQ